jgi:hypothetical protein
VGAGMTAHHGQYDQSDHSQQTTTDDFPNVAVVSNSFLLWKIVCGRLCRLWCDEAG